MSFDLLVVNARLPDAGQPTRIGVDDGEITAVAPDLTGGDVEVDAEGALVAGGFVDCHVHLDKAYIAPELPPNDTGTLGEAIANIHDRKASYTVEDVRERAVRAIRAHVRNGCTRIRTHVDVDTIGGLTPLEGVVAARDTCANVADVEIVAFPQEGIRKDEGTEALLDDALAAGADLVGGMPDNERTDADTKAHVDVCLDLASDHGVGVDMHVDETDDPSARSLEYLASQVVDRGFDAPVTAGHTCALAAYDEAHAQRVIDRVAAAELSMVTNPPTNLLLQGRHDQHPKRRGITRVDQLRDAGVLVAAGQDCILDGFYPYGRASMLETALLTAHAAHLQTPKERLTAWGMVASNAAAVRGDPHGVAVGSPATFNVFPPSVSTRHDALRLGRRPRVVVHDGRIVAKTEVESRVGFE